MEVLYMEKSHIFPYEIVILHSPLPCSQHLVQSNYKENRYVRESIWNGVSERKLLLRDLVCVFHFLPDRFRDLEKELGWHLLLTAKKRKSGSKPAAGSSGSATVEKKK